MKMAYIRNKDIKKVGVSSVSKDKGVILTKIKYGKNKKVSKIVPTYNYRGKLLTKPKKVKR